MVYVSVQKLINENIHWVAGRGERDFDHTSTSKEFRNIGLNCPTPAGRNTADLRLCPCIILQIFITV
jgi:hypothetical protein